VVRFVKHDGRASRLFPINGSLGSRRVRCFRASLTLAALHNNTILSQRLETELSAAPEIAPTGKEDKIFWRGEYEFREPSNTERHQTKEVTTLNCLPRFLHWSNPLGLAAKKRFQGTRAYYAVHRWRITVSTQLAASLATATQLLRCPHKERA